MRTDEHATGRRLRGDSTRLHLTLRQTCKCVVDINYLALHMLTSPCAYASAERVAFSRLFDASDWLFVLLQEYRLKMSTAPFG